MPKPPIQIKRSGTASATPSSLVHGELAINYNVADGKLFWKDSSNAIRSFAFASYLPTSGGTISGSLTVNGDLTVLGDTVILTTSTVVVEDKNIELGSVYTPTDTTADGGGITLLGSTSKTIIWYDATDSWTFNQNVELTSGFSYRINGTSVLNATTLGSGVTSSSLTSVGTVTTGVWSATAIGPTKGGTGLTSVPQGSVLVANAANTISALDGGGSADAVLVYTASTDSVSWTTTLDAARIANDSITYAKLQNVSATDRLLGRSSAGAGDVEEITCTAFGRSLIDDADAASARSTLSVQPTASPAFTGAATVTNDGNVVPLTITNTGTANSFVVNDASGDTSPFVIDASGNVGVGTSSPSMKFDLDGEFRLRGAGASSEAGKLHLYYVSSSNRATLTTGPSGQMIFETGASSPTERMRINATGEMVLSGQLLVTAGSGSSGSYKPGVAVSGDDDTGLQQVGGANTISLVTAGSERVRVGSGGRVAFHANSEKYGIQLNNGSTANGPFIGSAGADIFTVSASGGAELLRVDASGNTCIGSAGSSAAELSVFKDKNAGRTAILIDNLDQRLRLSCYYESGVGQYAEIQSATDSESGFQNLLLQRQGGEVLIGTTTDQGNFKLQVAGNTYLENLYLSTTVNYGRLAISHAGATTFAAGWNNTDTSSTGQTTLNILRNGTSVGTISTTNTATSYNTTSDYRLKANPRPITNATERIARIKPSQWDWHVGGVGEGFIAHELSEAVPLAVTGEKDAVDATGNPVWQTVDMSKVVPVLVAALQEANARIAALEERLSHA